MDGLTERQKLEQFWRDRVMEARQRYEFVTVQRLAIGDHRPVARTESDALAEYATALRAFTDLILRGRRP